MHYKSIMFIIIFLLSLNKLAIADSFVSIKSKANLRAGPGERYPINWVITFPNMPVKMLEKGNIYSKIELPDGTIGWIWNATISEKKSIIVLKDSYIFDRNKNNIAFVKKNVVLEKIKCNELVYNEKSCKIKIKNFKGYISEKNVWGITK